MRPPFSICSIRRPGGIVSQKMRPLNRGCDASNARHQIFGGEEVVAAEEQYQLGIGQVAMKVGENIDLRNGEQ